MGTLVTSMSHLPVHEHRGGELVAELEAIPVHVAPAGRCVIAPPAACCPAEEEAGNEQGASGARAVRDAHSIRDSCRGFRLQNVL